MNGMQAMEGSISPLVTFVSRFLTDQELNQELIDPQMKNRRFLWKGFLVFFWQDSEMFF